jgi:hypothetical protein
MMAELETYRQMIERYVRMCYVRRPPTKAELNGRTFEESIAGDVEGFMKNMDDVIGIVCFLSEYDHNPQILDYIERIRFDRIPERLRNKVAMFQKLLSQG